MDIASDERWDVKIRPSMQHWEVHAGRAYHYGWILRRQAQHFCSLQEILEGVIAYHIGYQMP